LQCVAVCCSVLQLETPKRGSLFELTFFESLICVALCCSVLQCDAVCCDLLQCVAVCCSVCVVSLSSN